MPDGVVLDPAYLAEVRARCEAIHSRTFDGPVARAMDDTRRLLAAAEQVPVLLAEVKRLREALTDGLSGWRYIRQRYGDLEGVGWERVERAAVAALGGAPDA